MLEVYCINYDTIDEEWIFDDIDRGDILDQFETFCIYDTEKKEITHSLLAIPESRGWVMGYVYAHQPLYKTNFYQITFKLDNKSQARLLPYIAGAIQEAREVIEAIEKEKATARFVEEEMYTDEPIDVNPSLPEFCNLCQKRGLVKVCGDYENCPHYKPYAEVSYGDETAEPDAEENSGDNDDLLNEIAEQIDKETNASKLQKQANDIKDRVAMIFGMPSEFDKIVEGLKETAKDEPVADFGSRKPFDINDIREIAKAIQNNFSAEDYFNEHLRDDIIVASRSGRRFIWFRFELKNESSAHKFCKVINYLRSLGFYVEPFGTTCYVSW